jgi:hypothetical protein
MSTRLNTPQYSRIEPDTSSAVELSNSRVEFEPGPAGIVARIEYDDWRTPEYAGPLPTATISALLEVGEVEA